MDAEDIELELEALQFTYAEAVTIHKELPLSVKVAIAPHTGGDPAEQYVAAELVLTPQETYPQHPPIICLQDAKGLGDAREAALLQRLQADAAESAGSMMLGMLCEVARDQLTLMNRPEGDCIFCLSPLCGDPVAAAESPLLKLPCYHCFHSKCFTRWWRWKQRSLRGARLQTLEDLGARAGPALTEQGLTPDDKGLFSVPCPSCRLKVTPQDLAHARPAMLPKKGTPAAEALERAEEASSTVALPAEQLQRLRLAQTTNAELFQRQKSRNGIVDESWGVSLAAAADKAGRREQESDHCKAANELAANPGPGKGSAGRLGDQKHASTMAPHMAAAPSSQRAGTGNAAELSVKNSRHAAEGKQHAASVMQDDSQVQRQMPHAAQRMQERHGPRRGPRVKPALKLQ